MYETRGKILVINEAQSFASGFTKREFVIETNDKYPQQLKFEVVKERCALLDGFALSDEVVVNFDIRGNEYNGRYFVNLSCWKIQAAGDVSEEPSAPRSRPSAAPARASQGAPRAQAEPSASELRNESSFDDEDEIPF